MTSASRRDSAGATPSNGSSSTRSFVPHISARASERHELLLAAAQRQRFALTHCRDFRHEAVGVIEPARRVGRVRGPARQQNVLLDRELRHQATVLGHIADAERRAAIGRQRDQILAGEGDAPGIRADKAHDRAQRGRLAGAVAADEADHLAGLERQTDATQHFDRLQLDAKRVDDEQGHGATPVT